MASLKKSERSLMESMLYLEPKRNLKIKAPSQLDLIPYSLEHLLNFAKRYILILNPARGKQI